MDKAVTLQKQIRDNVDDLQNFMKDLSSWEKEMKRMQSIIIGEENNRSIPPIRKKKKNVETCTVSKPSKIIESPSTRISAYDYAAWEKLDVRTASQLIKFWDNEKTKRKRILANSKRKPLSSTDFSEAILGPQFSGIENADINVFLETSVETNVNGAQNNHMEFIALEDHKRFDDSRFQPDKELERNIDEMSVATCKIVPMYEFDPSTKSSIPHSDIDDNPAFAASPSTMIYTLIFSENQNDKICDKLDENISSPTDISTEGSTEENDCSKAKIEENNAKNSKMASSLIEKAMYYKELGNKSVSKEKWDEAIDHYTQAIECYSSDAVFYANRALCYLKKKDYRSAEVDSTTSLRLDASYVKAYLRRASAREELRQYKEAREDLLKALEFEPSNNFAKKALSRLDKKLKVEEKPRSAKPNEKSSSKENSLFSNTFKKDFLKKGEKIIHPKKDKEKEACEISKNSKEVTTNDNESQPTSSITIGSKNLQRNFVTDCWLKEKDNVKVIQSIEKPPHLRSKKSMKQISIEEVSQPYISPLSNEILENEGNSSTSPPLKQIKVELVPCTTKAEKKIAIEKQFLSNFAAEHGFSPQENVDMKEDSNIDIPPIPETCIQFMSAWELIKNSPIRCYKYLKQINPNYLPNIFLDSLEYTVLSEILNTLVTKFIYHEENIYPYLWYLSHVKRFRALILFFTDADKEAVRKLIQYCKCRDSFQETFDIAQLEKLYEL